MRRILVMCAGLIILALANYSIHSRERLLSEGDVVLLQLAPVDPRSLMQGDYMALRFKIANNVRSSLASEERRDGHIVLAVDAKRIGTFARLDDGTPLAGNETRLRYRVRNGLTKFATNAFFFQEGDARLYRRARYGEFRVADDGEAILTGLRNQQLVTLGSALQK